MWQPVATDPNPNSKPNPNPKPNPKPNPNPNPSPSPSPNSHPNPTPNPTLDPTPYPDQVGYLFPLLSLEACGRPKGRILCAAVALAWIGLHVFLATQFTQYAQQLYA